MGNHSQWRKVEKNARRKRIRQKKAQERDAILQEEERRREASPSYQQWMEEQRKAEEFQEQEEARQALARHQTWLQKEEEAQKQWRALQIKLTAAREERERQNAKIRLEWEKEQKRLKEIHEQKQQEIEERRKFLIRRFEEVNEFIENGGDTPENLKGQLETNPGKPTCPFFHKTSTCRFFDVCSRNHIRPSISRIILIPNFYTHYSLEKTENDSITDSNLEFESRETYEHFREFFFDVVPELEKCGPVKQFKVCCNREAHLRGNVYIEYESTRSALKSYRTFNGRWYGGKQLSVEFCGIASWKSAICGLFFVKRCPKGNACNFLHVFRNPGNLFNESNRHSRANSVNNSQISERRNWRWSESPERVVQRDDNHCDRDKSERKRKHSSRSKSREKSYKRRELRESNRKRRSSSRRSHRKSRRRSRSCSSER